jgi:hypothetical protein
VSIHVSLLLSGIVKPPLSRCFVSWVYAPISLLTCAPLLLCTFRCEALACLLVNQWRYTEREHICVEPVARRCCYCAFRWAMDVALVIRHAVHDPSSSVRIHAVATCLICRSKTLLACVRWSAGWVRLEGARGLSSLLPEDGMRLICAAVISSRLVPARAHIERHRARTCRVCWRFAHDQIAANLRASFFQNLVTSSKHLFLLSHLPSPLHPLPHIIRRSLTLAIPQILHLVRRHQAPLHATAQVAFAQLAALGGIDATSSLQAAQILFHEGLAFGVVVERERALCGRVGAADFDACAGRAEGGHSVVFFFVEGGGFDEVVGECGWCFVEVVFGGWRWDGMGNVWHVRVTVWMWSVLCPSPRLMNILHTGLDLKCRI